MGIKKQNKKVIMVRVSLHAGPLCPEGLNEGIPLSFWGSTNPLSLFCDLGVPALNHRDTPEKLCKNFIFIFKNDICKGARQVAESPI